MINIRLNELILITLAMTFSCLPITSMAEIAGNNSELIAESTQCGPINNSEMILLKSTIPSNVSSCSFILSWSNATNNLDMALTSPAGVKIDSSAQLPIIYEKNSSLVYYIVPDPEPGIWSVAVAGNNVAQKGEEYCAYLSLDLASFEQQNSSAMRDLRSIELSFYPGIALWKI